MNMDQRSSGKTAVLASVAGVMIGGPLIGFMGISFAATMTLLLLTSPLFIIFSPVLFGAACVFAFSMLGFAAAGAMALVAVSSVAWVLQSFTGRRTAADYKLIQPRGGADGDQDWDSLFQQKPHHHHHHHQNIPIDGI